MNSGHQLEQHRAYTGCHLVEVADLEKSRRIEPKAYEICPDANCANRAQLHLPPRLGFC